MDSFFTIRNITNVLRQVSMVAIMSVGMFFVLVGAGIDLSAGATVGFTGIFFADLIVNKGVNPYLAILLTIVLGALIGLMNGLLVSYARLLPFIATVGTMSIAQGLALIWTNSYPVLDLPSSIEFLGRGYLFGLPFPIYVVIVVYIIAFIVTEKTVYGRFLFASGGNDEAAYLSGINVRKVRCISYIVCSVTVAISSIILCGRLDSAQPTNGSEWGFDAITACVLGGTSMSGGKGQVLGVLLGAIFVGILTNGMTLLNVNSNMQTVVRGVVLVIAVGFDVVRSRRAARG
ncbi:MAG: ABC transporter permease [Clostridiaceae bacterium]|nr:ABC transporter permease [Clostridiaceae bacterium]